MRYLSLALILLIFAGCSKESSEKAVVAPKSTEKAARPRPIVSVNGYALTHSNLNEKVEVMAKLMSTVNPKMTLDAVENAKKRLKIAYPQGFIRETVLEDYARKEKIEVGADILEQVRSNVLAAVKSGSGAKLSYPQLKKKFGSLGAGLDEMIRIRAVEMAVRDAVLAKKPLELPADYAASQLKKIREANAEMAQTNILIYARATNVWEQLKGGADFKETAVRYTEIEQEAKDGGEWGSLGLNQLQPDNKLIEWAQKLEVGQFSPPIEGDNGLMILRLDGKKGEDYNFSRIYFKLPLFIQEISEEELLKKRRARHEREVWGHAVSTLLKSAKVKWPKKVHKKKKGSKSELKSKKNRKNDVDRETGKKEREKEAK